MSKILFYPFWVSTHAKSEHGTSLYQGKPCDTPKEAKAIGKAEVEAGNATMSFVVMFKNGERTPLLGYIYPAGARKIVRHWEELWGRTEEE